MNAGQSKAAKEERVKSPYSWIQNFTQWGARFRVVTVPPFILKSLEL